jgi:hypothetical protein
MLPEAMPHFGVFETIEHINETGWRQGLISGAYIHSAVRRLSIQLRTPSIRISALICHYKIVAQPNLQSPPRTEDVAFAAPKNRSCIGACGTKYPCDGIYLCRLKPGVQSSADHLYAVNCPLGVSVMDWLSQLFEMVTVRGRLDLRCTFGAPWRIDQGAGKENEIAYHAVMRSAAPAGLRSGRARRRSDHKLCHL